MSTRPIKPWDEKCCYFCKKILNDEPQEYIEVCQPSYSFLSICLKPECKAKCVLKFQMQMSVKREISPAELKAITQE